MLIGAPNSVARLVSDNLRREPRHYGLNRWLVYEYVSGSEPILRAASADRSTAETHMTTSYLSVYEGAFVREGRVLVDVNSYLSMVLKTMLIRLMHSN